MRLGKWIVVPAALLTGACSSGGEAPEAPVVTFHEVMKDRIDKNADELWDAIEQGQPPPPAVASPRSVLVWRRGVTVIHRTLDPDEAALAPSLAAGTTFAAICEPLQDAERAVALLLRWLDAAVLRADP